MVSRALADYGESLNDPSYDTFAHLVATGQSATAAYRACFPDASENTAKKQASVLMAHPDMAGMIRDQQIGARGLLQAAAPRMATRLLHEAVTADKNTKPRIDAINSALDRAGVPRMKEIAISVMADAGNAAAAFEGYADALEAEVIEELTVGPDDLPTHPLELEAVDGDTEDACRVAWAAVISIDELRHVDAEPDPADDTDSND